MLPHDSELPAAPPSRPYSSRRWVLRLTALAAAVGLAAGLASCGAPRQGGKPAQVEPNVTLPASLFRKWPKPDLALILSGSMHGYLLPCGCSRPQIGGLERRYNFAEILRQKGWPLVAVDVGDVPQREGPLKLPNHQGLIKYRYAMKALQQIGYSAVGIGEYEASLSLFNALGEWALNEPSPRIVVANLKDADSKFPEQTRRWELAKVTGTDFTVGVAGLVGPTVAEKMKLKDSAVSFGPSGTALDGVLKEMEQAKVDLRVLLYQGSQTLSSKAGFPPEAVACAHAYPQFDVVLCLNEEDEPSAEPVWVPDAGAARRTLVTGLGHKGKYVGVVGVYRTGQADRPFDLRYQLVELTEAFLTPPERENDHPIVKLMEDYTRELRDHKYLGMYGQMRHSLQVAVKDVTPTYVGSDKCKACHSSAYDVWKTTPHSHAYQTLVDAKHPSNRQYDAECIVCHTVGFGYQGGFRDANQTPQLENVGCESCHGPGSEHVAHSKDKQWQELMNVWRAPEDESAAAKTKRLDRIDQFCITCHDLDNDVTWKDNAFPRKWKKIAHPTVPE
jgi:2',3'-cyclic-nucleotide 2'-phosphodiesterase (5'-nucleotidase family)